MDILDQITEPLMHEVADLTKNHEGGLAGLVVKLKDSGLADRVNSWISKGENV
jgi:uncharacterized protein YidB (DUF937 family)